MRGVFRTYYIIDWRYDKSGRLQEIWTDCGRGYVSGNDIVNYIICGYLVDKGFRVGGDPVHNFQKNFLRLTPPGRIEYIYPTFFLRHGIDNF